MKKVTLGIVLGLAIASTNVLADVASDLEAGLPLEQVIANAELEGISIEDAVAQIIKADPSLAEAAITAAVTINPTAAQAIVNAAVDAGVDAGQAQQVAIATGVVDPGSITEATASPGQVTTTPGNTPTTPTAPQVPPAPPAGGGISG